MKAYRGEDGSVLLFRPELNAMRMNNGAERMCMHSPSIQQFIEGVKQTVLSNKRLVPPPGKGSLYLRPLLFGGGASLGVAAASEYMFLVYGFPVKTILRYIGVELVRGGGDSTRLSWMNWWGYLFGKKVLEAMRRAKSRGFSDVLYLDAETGKNLEEVYAANIFLVKVYKVKDG